MQKIPHLKNGFTLVELMVVIAIISVLSVSSVVGFNRLGEVLRLKQSLAFIADSVTLAEQKVLRQEEDRIEIIFGELELNDEFEVTNGAGAKVVIEAPYAKKTFYKKNGDEYEQTDKVTIKLESADSSAEGSITLK